MGSSIFLYIRQLEILVFFSGYPLVYYLVRFFSRNKTLKRLGKTELVSILPYAYALTGTLYVGFLIRNLYPDFSFENIRNQTQQSYLVIWAILSILFWIPAISRKHILCMLHSLVFFLLILKDLFVQLTGFNPDPNILKNDMKVYTVSIVLNLSAFIILVLFSLLFPIRKKIES
jgi:hypothetical protein